MQSGQAKPQESLVARGRRIVLIGVFVNMLLAIIKIVTGVMGGSYALIADGVESSLDVVSSVVVWSGLQIASAQADADHPYGHGKAEPLAAIVAALMLIGAAIALAIESIREILAPHYTPAWYTLIVLVLVIVTKEGMYRFAFKIGDSADSTAVRTDAWHHRSDAITSAAAFVGISIALFAGKGYESADDWAALFACMIIAVNGVRLLRTPLAEAMDAAPPAELYARIRDVAGRVDGVAAMDYCQVRKVGLDIYVDLHISVDGYLTVRDGHAISHRVKDALLSCDLNIRNVVVHIEPMVEAGTQGLGKE